MTSPTAVSNTRPWFPLPSTAPPAATSTTSRSPWSKSTYPIGSVSVRTVGDIEKQFLNRATLTQSIVPYFQFLDAQEHVREDFTFGDGYDGVRVLVSYADDTGAEVGVAYMISVTDPSDNRMYSIVAGCSRAVLHRQPRTNREGGGLVAGQQTSVLNRTPAQGRHLGSNQVPGDSRDHHHRHRRQPGAASIRHPWPGSARLRRFEPGPASSLCSSFSSCCDRSTTSSPSAARVITASGSSGIFGTIEGGPLPLQALDPIPGWSADALDR